MLCDGKCLEDSEQKDHSINESMNELINYKGVYRTVPSTPGLMVDPMFMIV